MNQPLEPDVELLPGIVHGAVASSLVGSIVGFVLWTWGVNTSLPDILIEGGVFGMFVGAIGAATGGSILRSFNKARSGHELHILCASVAVSAILGSIPGIMLGVSTNSGMINPIIFGIFGAIGALVGILVVMRRITRSAKL